MNEPVADAQTPKPQRPAPRIKRAMPAAVAAQHLNSRQRKFADIYLSGVSGGRAYEQAGFKAKGDVADTLAAQTLRLPRVAAYVGAVRDQSVAHVVLSQEILHSLALALARGDRDDSTPSVQLEAIRYLDACLNRNRTICIEGLTLKLDADERHVAALAYAALEAEARGELGAEDARHLIESAALVQQIMHGKTLAEDVTGSVQPRLSPPQANGHANGASVPNGNGSTTVTTQDAGPVRPKWLKSPEAIAAAAAQRAAKRAKKDG